MPAQLGAGAGVGVQRVAPPDGTIPVGTTLPIRNFVIHRPSASNLGAGLVTAAISLVYALSFSALIFAGPLTPLLPYGLAALLITAAVTSVVVAMGSRIPFVIAGPDSNTATVLATIAPR